MEHPKQTALIERLFEIRSQVRGALCAASGVSAKLVGEPDGNEGAQPDRVQESVNSLVDDIGYGMSVLQKILAEQHGILGAFAPPQPTGRAIRA